MVVTNEMRSAWAEHALNVFTEETYYGRSPEQLTPDDQECAVTDLICDLLHYAHSHGFNCDDIVRRSAALFKEEVEDEFNWL